MTVNDRDNGHRDIENILDQPHDPVKLRFSRCVQQIIAVERREAFAVKIVQFRGNAGSRHTLERHIVIHLSTGV